MRSWDDKIFSSDVDCRVVDRDGFIKEILYNNEPFLGKPTEVFAYMGIPDTKEERVPGMVCVHGGGGTAFKNWVEMWVERGYAAIAMDLSGRDGNRDRLPNGGPEQDHVAKFNTTLEWEDMWTYHAVAAAARAHSLLANLDIVDPTRIGITGISWGGYVTCITAAVDTRFSCATSVYGCGLLQQGSADDWMKIFADMTEAQRQEWHDSCDPSVYLENVETPMLFVSGTNDGCYPLGILDRSCDLPAGDVTRCIRVGMAHGHNAAWVPEEIGLFADQHLVGGPSLPKVGPCEVSDDSLIAPVKADRPISRGYLAYTRCRSRWQDRKWQTTAAEVLEGAVSAELPEGVSACFMAVEDDLGAYVSSPLMEFQCEA